MLRLDGAGDGRGDAMAVTHGGNLFEVSRKHGWDWHDVIDFSASINPLGPAPGVFDAIRNAIEKVTHYPEREPLRLRRALAELWHVDEDRILLGNGATELLHFFARAEAHEHVTLAVPVFSEFHRAYPRAETVQADDPRSWPADHLLVLTQPNNPTGQTICWDALESWLAATANPVLIDESFLEFTGLRSAMRLPERANLFVLRSLTKFYALPGLRVGALVAGAEVAARWREMREPWQVNVLAEEAALAAVADAGYARRSVEFIAEERSWLLRQLESLGGIHPLPSAANYVFVQLDYPATTLCRHFLEAKILIRNCTGTAGVQGEAVRVAVRTRPENEKLIKRWSIF
jgi:threonine-phosphate decarboxylase